MIDNVNIEKKDGVIEVTIKLPSSADTTNPVCYKTSNVETFLRAQGHRFGERLLQPGNGGVRNDILGWSIVGKWIYKDLDFVPPPKATPKAPEPAPKKKAPPEAGHPVAKKVTPKKRVTRKSTKKDKNKKED
jgi:hypothetical protein